MNAGKIQILIFTVILLLLIHSTVSISFRIEMTSQSQPSSHIRVHVVIEIKREVDLNIFKELLEETRKEPGCLQYDLYEQTNENDNNSAVRRLAMIECWESQDHMEKHLAMPHLDTFFEKHGQAMTKEVDIMIYKPTTL